MTRIFVGVAGLPGAGKGRVVGALAELGFKSGFQSFRYSLSDEIREELIRTGKAVTRTALINQGNELREKYGKGILAQRIAAKIQSQLASATSPNVLVIIDAIRNPGEVDAFRLQWPNDFYLIAVVASESVRKERLAARGREGERGLSEEEARADRSIGVDMCIKMANWQVGNDGSLDELESSVQRVWEEHLLPRR